MLEGPAPSTVAAPLHLAPEPLHSLVASLLFFTTPLPRVRPSARAGTVDRAHAPVSRQTINQEQFVTHRAATRDLPPSFRLRSVPSPMSPCFSSLPLK
jgi:hypothetical protein